MVGRRFLGDPPPVIGVTAERTEIEHRLPVQQIVGHQLALVVGRPPEEVVGGRPEAKDHDAAQRVTLVLRQVQSHPIAGTKEVDRRLVVGRAGEMDTLALGGIAGEPGKGLHVLAGLDRDALSLRQVQVIARLRFEPRLERLRLQADW